MRGKRLFLTGAMLFLSVSCFLPVFLSSAAEAADAPFHIGIVTGTVSQSEDDLRGAEVSHSTLICGNKL
jgi:hypothetical protein